MHAGSSIESLIFETKRFRIRQATMDDVDGWLSFWNDPEVMRFIYDGDGTWGGGEDVVHEVLRKYILYYEAHPGLGDWAVEDKSTGKVVGEVSVEIMQQTGEIEVGYILCKAYWGKGFGTELLLGLLNHCFTQLKLAQVCAVTNPVNAASIRVMEKCGMSFVGRVFDRKVWLLKFALSAKDFTRQTENP